MRAAGLFPWLEVEVLQALAAAACEAACEAGERIAAAALAGNAGLDALAERLEAGGERRRVRLDVLLRAPGPQDVRAGDAHGAVSFFGKTADHLAIAEEISLRRHVGGQRAPLGRGARLRRPRVHGDVGGRDGAARPRAAVRTCRRWR